MIANKETRGRRINSPKEISNNFILDNIERGKVCDLCCGSGNTIGLLKNKVDEIVGVDISSKMIETCKDNFSRKDVTLILSSALNTPLESGYFDYVIVRRGLHHIKDKVGLLKEVKRILKPNGKFILIDKYYRNWWGYYFLEILNLILRFDRRLLSHFIISKQANFSLLKDFIVLTETYPPERKWTTQSFMLVLEKMMD